MVAFPFQDLLTDLSIDIDMPKIRSERLCSQIDLSVCAGKRHRLDARWDMLMATSMSEAHSEQGLLIFACFDRLDIRFLTSFYFEII